MNQVRTRQQYHYATSGHDKSQYYFTETLEYKPHP